MFQKRSWFNDAEDRQMTMFVTSKKNMLKDANGPLIISCPLDRKKLQRNLKQPGVCKKGRVL